MSHWLLYAGGGTVMAGGLVAGVFLAFSDVVMKSLRAACPAAAIEVMQIINRRVYRSVFLVLLMSVAGVSIILAAYAWRYVPGAASAWLVAGATVYLTGVFLVTLTRNVPMNRHLDEMDPGAAKTAEYWETYLSSWTSWNHVRTIASVVSTACQFVGCLLLSQV